MEYSKDIIFNVKYDEVNSQIKVSKEKWTSRLNYRFKQYKIISIITVICSALIFLDMILIYNFTNILQNL